MADDVLPDEQAFCDVSFAQASLHAVELSLQIVNVPLF